MPFGKLTKRKIRTDHLPGPIATSYRRIFTLHEPNVERLMFILDTAEITARFLSATVLCSLRELAQSGLLEPPLIDFGNARMRLKKPSFGIWMELLREGARRLHGKESLFEDKAAGALAMEICQFVFNQNGKTKGRPYSNLDAILVIRNKVHHPAEALDIPSLCEEAEDHLTQTLSQLDFFEDYPLYVVKQINLKRRRLSSVAYLHQCFLLQGEIDFPTAESDQRTWHTETDEVLVYRDDTSYLNMDPLFVYIHPDEIDRAKTTSEKNAEELHPGLYCFAGYAAKASGLVVDYLPCSSSTKSFRTSNPSFRDAQMPGYLNQGIEELLDLLESPKTPSTAEE